jgi:hypothetical protein
MIAFIDDHREVHGVEPICKVLPIAPSTYHAHVARRADPTKLSDRARRDLALKPEVARIFAENFEVYGARKVWRQLRREGFAVARCTVERLMRAIGLSGVIRGKPVKTTVSNKAAPCPLDRVNRQFNAPAPNRCQRRRFLRQCSRRNDQRALQGRGHSPARAVAILRGRRVRDTRMGRLVQPPAIAGADRQYLAGRSRGTLLRHAGATRHGRVT